MTSGQRKMHVLMWLVIGPIALVGLTLAVVWQPAEPVQEGELPGVTNKMQLNEPLDHSGGGGKP